MATDYLPFDNYKIIEQVPSVIDSEHVRDKVVGIKCPKCKERMKKPQYPIDFKGWGVPEICTNCGLVVQRDSHDLLRCNTESVYIKYEDVIEAHKQTKSTFWENWKKVFLGR